MRGVGDIDARHPPPEARVLDLEHADYPPGLNDLADPPRRLFVLGSLPTAPAVAVVGSRAATPYGLAFARRLAQDLARVGTPVVSGLARGIDAAAHRGALEANGVTVAVIPSGLDAITPRHHAELAAEIARGGGLATEIASGGPRHRAQFVQRNRLIAAMACATVVVEAAEGSGALTTAAAARKLGRPVLAVPGDVDRPTARGCHQLLREGARVCEHAGDVLAVLEAVGRGMELANAPRGPETARRRSATPAPRRAASAPDRRSDLYPPAPESAPSNPEARLWAALSSTPQTIDAISAKSGLPISEALALLTRLQWAGLVTAGPGPRWRRAR